MIRFAHPNNGSSESQQNHCDAADSGLCSSDREDTSPAQQELRADSMVTRNQGSLRMSAHEREPLAKNKGLRDADTQSLSFSRISPTFSQYKTEVLSPPYRLAPVDVSDHEDYINSTSYPYREQQCQHFIQQNSQLYKHLKQTLAQNTQQPCPISPAPAIMLGSAASTSDRFANMNTFQLSNSPHNHEPDQRTQFLLPLQNHVHSSHYTPQTPFPHYHNHHRSLSDSALSCTVPPFCAPGPPNTLGGVLAFPSHFGSSMAMDTLTPFKDATATHIESLNDTLQAQQAHSYTYSQPHLATWQSFNTTTLQYPQPFIPPFVNICSFENDSKDHRYLNSTESGYVLGGQLEATKKHSKSNVTETPPCLMSMKDEFEHTAQTSTAGSKRKPAYENTLVVQRWRPDDGSRHGRQHAAMRKGTGRAAATKKSRKTTMFHSKRTTDSSRDAQFAACTSMFWAFSPDSIPCSSKLYDASPTLTLPAQNKRPCDAAGVSIHRRPQTMHTLSRLASFPLPTESMASLSRMALGSFSPHSAPAVKSEQPYGQPCEQYGGSLASIHTPPAAWPVIRTLSPPVHPDLKRTSHASSTLVASPNLRGCGLPTQQRLLQHPVCPTTMTVATPHPSASTFVNGTSGAGFSIRTSNGLDGGEASSSSSDGSGSSTPVLNPSDEPYMLYRKSKLGSPSLLHFNNLSSGQISAEIAELWKRESEEVKLQYLRQAQMEKQAFVQAFPDYKFRRSKSKSARSGQDSVEEEISRSKELATVEGRLGMVLEEESRSRE
ncbi:unnamed protein product [Mortierella alpina]